nr:hypothetical protein [Tanacetum cinerariifolium]
MRDPMSFGEGVTEWYQSLGYRELVDEDEDPKEDKLEEEEDSQEEEDDMEIDIEKDENEPEMTYPYEEMDHLNPLPPASESELDDVIEVENLIEHEDETIPASIREVCESSAAPFLRKDSDSLLHGLIRRAINSLFGQMASILRRLCGRETAHALVEKKGKEKDKFYGKLILELGNEVRFSVEQGTTVMKKLVEKLGNTEDENERVKRDLYYTRVRAHEIYQEMIRRGFMFEERPNEAEKSHVNDAIGSGPARGQDATPAVRECTFAGFMKCNPAVFCDNIKGEVTSSKLADLNESVRMAHKLMEQKS